MKVLVVGGGGREHAIVWGISKSSLEPEVFIAPGNPGTALLGTNVPVAAADIEGLLTFARQKKIDLTIVGPEQPLVAGIVDAFEAAGLTIFGPSAAAAKLEGSKSFAKDFMARHGIPTALYKTFAAQEYDQAKSYLIERNRPCVLKASGLAAGKGVLMCSNLDEALEGLDAILVNGRFGEAGAELVIEEWMEGEEASVFALTDGEHYLLLASAQDHKRVGEGDTGPNTGGMGAYAPAPIVTDELLGHIAETIVEPTLKGMAQEGRPYRGVLYCGLMITREGPKVVEFNCRFGDPEAQVLIPLLQDDLLQLIVDLIEGKKPVLSPDSNRKSAACVVLASGGYPGGYEKGKRIDGLEKAKQIANVLVFHAGTRRDGDVVITNGGRVLGVISSNDTLAEALDNVYRGVACIDFDGMQYRTDIGKKGLKRLESVKD